jgi:hypothetical protein
MPLILAQVHVSTDSSRLIFWAAIGAGFGVVLFVRGFLMLGLKRVILNTPESKIRSAAMGLVEIEGLAKGPHTIPAGITGEPCFYYRAVAWQLRESGRSSQWKKVADEGLYLPFFIEDSTGRLMVHPEGADLDICCNFKDQIGGGFFSHADMLPENVSAFLGRNGLALTDSTRLEEYCIKPDYPLFVLGTLDKNEWRGAWIPALQVGSSISLKSRMNPFGSLGKLGFQIVGASVGVAATQSRIVPSQVPVTPITAGSARVSPAPTGAAKPPSSSWSTVSMDEAGMTNFGAALARHAASSRTTVATADPDPPRVAPPSPPLPLAAPPAPPAGANGFELNPAVAIAKGENGAPFTIASHSQKEVVRELAWKSSLCIWGGPVLTLVSLFVLLSSLGVL